MPHICIRCMNDGSPSQPFIHSTRSHVLKSRSQTEAVGTNTSDNVVSLSYTSSSSSSSRRSLLLAGPALVQRHCTAIMMTTMRSESGADGWTASLQLMTTHCTEAPSPPPQSTDDDVIYGGARQKWTTILLGHHITPDRRVGKWQPEL